MRLDRCKGGYPSCCLDGWKVLGICDVTLSLASKLKQSHSCMKFILLYCQLSSKTYEVFLGPFGSRSTIKFDAYHSQKGFFQQKDSACSDKSCIKNEKVKLLVMKQN